MNVIWHTTLDSGPDALPLLAAAIHDGHTLRPDVAAAMALSDAERLREEDPFTAHWATVSGTRLTGTHSRFQVDLNRPRDRAVYRTPDDAWGLTVWQGTPPTEMIAASLAEYDAFYAHAAALLQALQIRHGRFVVYDIHSYNHRRAGPDAPPAPNAANPEINIGTATLHDRARWSPVIDRFTADLSGHRFDVRENVKFGGGHFARWIHDTLPDFACVLSIEFKKTFMDEWTGQPDPVALTRIHQALAATVPGVIAALAEVRA